MCKRMKGFIEKIKEKIKDFFDTDDEVSIFDEYDEYDYADEDYDEYGEDEVSIFEKYNGQEEESSIEVIDIEDVSIEEDDDIVDIIDGKIYK